MRSDDKDGSTEARGTTGRPASPGRAEEIERDPVRGSSVWRDSLRAVPKSVWFSVAVLAIAALAFGVKRYLDTRVAWGYTLIDSKVPAVDRQMYWLDNERVLFLGGELIREGPDFGKYRGAMLIYDVRKRETTVYRRDVRSLLCVADKHVAYTVDEGGEEKRYDGELGKELHIPWRTKQEVAAAPDLRANPLTCRLFDHGPYKREGKAVKPLRDGDGVLELGPLVREEWYQQNPIRLIRGSDGAAIELPIERRQAYHVHYAPFRGEYLLMRSLYQPATIEWSGKSCEPIWWLRPDGSTEKECLPYLPVLSLGFGHAIPWRHGVVFSYHRGAGQFGPGDGGLYLWRRYGLPRRVLPGVLSYGVLGHPVVSPDGCRVAFGYAQNMSQNRVPERTLRVLELCQGDHANGQGSPESDRVTRKP